MSNWWIPRLIWLIFGLLVGVIAVLPESAEILTGIVASSFWRRSSYSAGGPS